MKTCSKCTLSLSEDNFHKNSSTKDKLHAWCKNCSAINKHGKPYKGKRGTYLMKSLEKDGNKFCTYCKVYKPIDEFRNYTLEKSNYRRSTCYDCENTQRIVRSYNITEIEYKNLVVKQRNLCYICGEPELKNKSLCVDHDHETNKVRGLLCTECNQGLGLFKDKINLLSKAIEYLTLSK